MKIVTKHVLREHAGPLVFALSALTSLLLLNYVARQLGQLVGKGLPWTVITEFMLLSVPFTVAMTLPMAVLVSTLHAFSRLASDNEITALKASGISVQRLMMPVMAGAGVLTLIMVWFNDQVLPRANHELATLTSDIARKKPTFALREQVINEVAPGKLFLRAGRLVSGTNLMREVSIFDLGDPQRRRTIRADSGLLALSSDGRDLLLTLYDGNMVELTTQEPARLQRLFFRVDHLKVRGVGNSLERDTAGTIKSDREMTICELQDRLVKASQTRDSAFKSLLKLAPGTAVRQPRRPAGLGRVYCGAIAALSVRTAQAAEVPRIPTREPAEAPADLAQQPAPRRPAPAQQAPDAGPPPSAGGVPVQAPIAGPPAQRPSDPSVPNASVLAEGMKMQLAEAERVANGSQVEIEKKFAIATACMIFALLGAPIALRFPRGGVGITIGVSLVVFGLYYMSLIVGESLARRNYVSPFWAMWGANLLFVAVGALLTARLGHEGATSRGSDASEFLARLTSRLLHREAPQP